MAQEIPRVKIWNPARDLVGLVPISNDSMDSLRVHQSGKGLGTKLARISFWENELIYKVEQDGRLTRGMNRKRAMGEMDFGMLKKLLQPSFDTLSINRPRLQSDPGTRWKGQQRKRSRSLPPRERNAQSLKDHEASTMSRESPGQRRKPRQKSGSAHDLGDSITLLSSSSLEKDNPLDSSETEGKVTKVQRIKPHTERKIKKHSSESDAVTTKREERNSQADGNAHGENSSNDSKHAPRGEDRSWGWQWRTGTAAVEPRFDPPEVDRRPVHPPTPCAKAMKPPGGVKPTNTLTSGHVNSAYVPQRRKAFNLTEDHESHRNKRPKTTGGPILNKKLAREVHDVDSQAMNSQRRRESSAAMSGQTCTNNGASARNANNPVPEYSNVEGMVDPTHRSSQTRNRLSSAKRKNSNSTRHTSQEQEHSKFRTSKPITSSGGSTVVRLDNEDPGDPISDDELETVTDLQPGITSSRARVVIQSSYKGTSNLRRLRNSADRPPELTSRHFPTDKDGSGTSSRFGGGANSAIGLQKYGDQEKISWDNDDSLGGKRSRFSPNAQSGTDESIDHLLAPEHISKDQPAWDKAGHLLSEFKKIRGSSATGENGALRSHTVIDDSEDELTGAQNSADIKSTKFDIASSMKHKKKRKSEDERYSITQAFSHKEIWLPDGEQSPWSLLYDHKSKTLTLLDLGENIVIDFLVASIQQIEYHPDSPRVVVHKPRDMSGRVGHQVFFKFQDRDQSNSFARCLAENDRSVNQITKLGGYLDKVFGNILGQHIDQKKRVSYREEADDIRLIKKKQAGKTRLKLDEAQAGKRSTQRLVDRLTDEDYESRRETRGNSPSRKLRSSSGPTEIADITKRKPRQSELPPSNFYDNFNKSHIDDHTGTRSSSRITNRAPPRERTPSPIRWTQQNPKWSDAWRSSIVYPREGKNRASVDMQDIQRLDEGQYLNDSLINFYLRWLEEQLLQKNPNLAKRIYFNNTFFYKTLTKVTRSPKGINYEAVERWTAKVDLLSYDYIIVPVNESTHWYVALICNAPKLLPLESETSHISHSQSLANETSHRQAISPNHKFEPSSRSPNVSKLASVGFPEQEMRSLESLSLRDDVWEIKEDIPRSQPDLERINLIRTTPPRRVADDDLSDTAVGEASRTSTSRPVTASIKLAGGGSKVPTPVKKSKRKSGAPGLRKYDPTEPRIITLDSLGMKHSPTCTNLRDYIVAEVKARRRIEVPPPGSLGTTALNIPQQDNYCDCGLFLLSYIEKFLEEPDEFVHDILQQNPRINDKPWSAASNLRVQIRQLLFDLQQEQVTEAEKLKLLKARSKRATAISEKKAKSAKQPESREVSESARNSSTPEDLRSKDRPPPKEYSQGSRDINLQTVVDRKRSASIDVNKSMDDSKRRKQATPETGAEGKYLGRGNRFSKIVHDLVGDDQEPHLELHCDIQVNDTSPGYEQPDQPGADSFSQNIQGAQRDAPSLRSSARVDVSQPLSSAIAGPSDYAFSGSDTNTKQPEHLQSGASRMHAVEIHDSPEKTSTRRFPRRAEDLSRRGGGSKSPSRPESRCSKSNSRGPGVKTVGHQTSLLPSDRAAASKNSQSRAPENTQESDTKVNGKIPASDDEMLLNGEFGARPLSSPDISPPSSSPAGREDLTQRPQINSPKSQLDNHTRRRSIAEQRQNQPWAIDGADRAIVGSHVPKKTKVSAAANRKV